MFEAMRSLALVGSLVVSLLFVVACGDDLAPPLDGGGDTGTPGSCEVPEELCGTRCINTQNDGRNCGGCGMECAAGSFCSAGVCSRSCPGGTMACGGSCADLATDRDHCGGCDNACAEDEACRGGACLCPEGYTECGGTCINPDGDMDNCGVCDRSCDADQICSMGMCTCAAGGRETECTDEVDDDCDGLVDCADPDCAEATRACMGICGTGAETCDGAGTWGVCEGGSGEAEICGDGIDQDCDGVDPRNPDPYEDNNSCSSCALLSPMTDPMLTINARFDSVDDGVDCYRFIADDSPSRERVQIDLTNIPEGHDYDVYLYRNFDDCVARNPLVSGVNTENADESLTYWERFALDDGGTYYIRVVRFRGHSCEMNYELSVDGLNPL